MSELKAILYPGYEEWLNKHPVILQKALKRIKEKIKK